jgi:Protein of unknown function (DUF1501)
MRSSDLRISRRDWLKLAAAGVTGFSLSGWLGRLAADTAADPQRRRSCILLWMDGGPSTIDMWDLKPGHANGGPFQARETSVPGIRISEHLPKIGQHMEHMAIIRSMTTREGDHGRAAYFLRTGYMPAGEIQYPPIGALLAHELGAEDAVLPKFVSIAPDRGVNPAAYSPGFLGPQYAPLVVGDAGMVAGQQGQNVYERALRVENLEAPHSVLPSHVDARIDLVAEMDRGFLQQHQGSAAALNHQAAYDRAARLVRSAAGKAFDLDDEKDAVRDAYGRNLFGQGCLLARRLVERGVPFVEVTLGGVNGGVFGWDTHAQNFDIVQRLCGVLDTAWAALMEDLQQRGLLDTTLIVWMGEFGRTPQINPQRGRDHFPNAWSTVLAGGGIKGGQVIGATSPDGVSIKDRPVSVPDFLATICTALGVDPLKQNMSNVGRPIRIVDKTAQPIKEAVA